MSTHAEMPLHLYQVLEEEYLSLHGALAPEEMVVTLNGRAAVARLDWGFHRGTSGRRTGSHTCCAVGVGRAAWTCVYTSARCCLTSTSVSTRY